MADLGAAPLPRVLGERMGRLIDSSTKIKIQVLKNEPWPLNVFHTIVKLNSPAYILTCTLHSRIIFHLKVSSKGKEKLPLHQLCSLPSLRHTGFHGLTHLAVPGHILFSTWNALPLFTPGMPARLSAPSSSRSPAKVPWQPPGLLVSVAILKASVRPTELVVIIFYVFGSPCCL